mgnify:CR=1 FL=1
MINFLNLVTPKVPVFLIFTMMAYNKNNILQPANTNPAMHPKTCLTFCTSLLWLSTLQCHIPPHRTRSCPAPYNPHLKEAGALGEPQGTWQCEFLDHFFQPSLKQLLSISSLPNKLSHCLIDADFIRHMLTSSKTKFPSHSLPELLLLMLRHW